MKPSPPPITVIGNYHPKPLEYPASVKSWLEGFDGLYRRQTLRRQDDWGWDHQTGSWRAWDDPKRNPHPTPEFDFDYGVLGEIGIGGVFMAILLLGLLLALVIMILGGG